MSGTEISEGQFGEIASEVKHVAFVPIAAYYGMLQGICDDQAREGWALLRIVPHHTYEAVAVFERTRVSEFGEGTP